MLALTAINALIWLLVVIAVGYILLWLVGLVIAAVIGKKIHNEIKAEDAAHEQRLAAIRRHHASTETTEVKTGLRVPEHLRDSVARNADRRAKGIFD